MRQEEQSRGRRGRSRFPGAVAFALAATIVLAAQTAEKPDQVSRRARLRGGADPNVKSDEPVNVRSKPSGIAPPASKAPAGQPQCAVTFDNHTDLFTKTYVDGHYAGTIRPFGTLTAGAAPGVAVLYARAEYDDGSADAWGPIRISCQTRYMWRLAD
jgi:hypothetical protein